MLEGAAIGSLIRDPRSLPRREVSDAIVEARHPRIIGLGYFDAHCIFSATRKFRKSIESMSS